MNKNPTTRDQRAGKPARFEPPPSLWRGRGGSTAGGCRLVVGVGCWGWMSEVGCPHKVLWGFSPSLVGKNVANAAPLRPTAQGSTLPPSPALPSRNATRGQGGVAFLPTRIPHTKNVANAAPLPPTAQGSTLPPSPALPSRNATRGQGGVAFLPTRIPHTKNVANATPFVLVGCRGWLSGSAAFPLPPPSPRTRGGPLTPLARAQCHSSVWAVAVWLSRFWKCPTQHNEAYYCWQPQ